MRTLESVGCGGQKTRPKRLWRFLNKKDFCPEVMMAALAGRVMGGVGKGLVPILGTRPTSAGRLP